MHARPLGLEQALVGGVPHQRVLEDVGRVGRRAAPEDQLGLDQPLQRVAAAPAPAASRQRGEVAWCELAADHGRDLRHLLDRVQPVEPGHQRVVQGGRDREAPTGRPAGTRRPSRQRPDSSTALVSSSTNSGTPSVRATISSSTSAGSRLPPADPLDDRRGRGRAPSRFEREPGHVRVAGQGGGRTRARQVTSDQHRRPAIRSSARLEQLQRGRVDPVRVLEHRQHRPPRGETRSAGRPGRRGCGRGAAAASASSAG